MKERSMIRQTEEYKKASRDYKAYEEKLHRKDAEEIMVASGQKRIEVAYGACGAAALLRGGRRPPPTMAATGRGELAVPTTGTYKACVDAFTKERESDASKPPTSKHTVSLENEDFTSKMCWYTGKAYEKVYKVYETHGDKEKEFLRHTTGKQAPVVGVNEDVEAVLKKRAEQKCKVGAFGANWPRSGQTSKRRGGDGAAVPVAPISSADARDAKVTRHIDVRGLLFCPENRMFFVRDDESARAIAGLRCIRLAGLGRPSAFRRKKQPGQQVWPLCGQLAPLAPTT